MNPSLGLRVHPPLTYVPLQLLVSLLMRGEVVPDIVVEHLATSVHPHPPLPFVSGMTVTLLSSAPVPTLFCHSFSHTKSLYKNIQLSTARLSAHSSSQTFLSPVIQPQLNRDSISLALQTEEDSLTIAISEHRNEV